MKLKYFLGGLILLLLVGGILIYKMGWFSESELKNNQVNSDDLIQERINAGKKNDDGVTVTEEVVTETETKVITETTTIETVNNSKKKVEKNDKKQSTESVVIPQKEPEKTGEEPVETKTPVVEPEPVKPTNPVTVKTSEEKLEEIIDSSFDKAVSKNQITKYEYPFQIDNNLKNKIEKVNGTSLDYSKDRFYIVNNTLLNDGNFYIYDKNSKHVIKVDNKAKRSTGTWFWCSKKNHEVLIDESKQKDFFDKLSKYNITEIYMSYHHKQLNDDNIRRFIRNAYKRNIRVYLCLGELDFLKKDSYQSSIYEVFDCVDNYNKLSKYDERFAGVSYDAEVWNNHDYNWKKDVSIRDQHVAYIKEAKKYADSKNLSVIFTLSFWLVQYNTSTGNMYDEITQVLDRTTLMVYRDTYEKINHLVVDKQENASDSLINIASKNNCLIDIAVETMYSDEGNQVSFYEEEKANPGYLLSTLSKVNNNLNKYNNRMFSIHHAMSLINDFNGGLK